MILVIVALQEEVEILVKEEDLQGAWVIDLHPEEDLLQEETLVVMMTGEEEAHHRAVLPLIAMEEVCGVEVGTDPLPEEDLHQGVVLLHAVEAEMMDLLIGAEETDLLPVMTHP